MLMDMILTNRKAARIRRSPEQVYFDPTSLTFLQTEASKFRPHARLFVDKIVLNHEVASDNYLKLCDYIFMIREPESTLNWLVTSGKFKSVDTALRYYCFRLRRLCEMAKKTPRRVVVTWDELVDKSCLPELKKFLGMKELTSVYKPTTFKKVVDVGVISKGQKCYDKHLQYLRAIVC